MHFTLIVFSSTKFSKQHAQKSHDPLASLKGSTYLTPQSHLGQSIDVLFNESHCAPAGLPLPSSSVHSQSKSVIFSTDLRELWVLFGNKCAIVGPCLYPPRSGSFEAPHSVTQQGPLMRPGAVPSLSVLLSIQPVKHTGRRQQPPIYTSQLPPPSPGAVGVLLGLFLLSTHRHSLFPHR